MRKILFFIIFFMYLFSFKLPIVNSSIYAALISASIVFTISINSKTLVRKDFVFVISTFKWFLLPYLAIAMYASVITIAHATNDFSYSISILKSLIYIFAFIPVGILFQHWFSGKYTISYFIYGAFLVQSIIICICLTNEPVRNMVRLFQFEGVSEVADRYDGIRGLALAGPQFFGLACSFVLVFFFMAKDYLEHNISLKYMLCSLPFLMVAGLTVGRTTFIGIFVLFFILIFQPLVSVKISKSAFKLIMSLILLGLMLCIILLSIPTFNDLIVNKIVPFAFEFIISFIDTGKLTTTSTDVLSNMYFHIPYDTFFWGDGKYAGSMEGTYYLETDAGYMRPILFGGVFFIFTLCFYWLIVFFKFFWLKKSRLTFFTFITTIFILQYKGEALMVQPMVITTLVPLMLLQYYRMPYKREVL